jgi:hypothetical protein
MTECQHIRPRGLLRDSLCPRGEMRQLHQLAGSLPVDPARRLADPQTCLIGPGLEMLADRLPPMRAAMGTKSPPYKIHKISKISQNLQNLERSKFRVLPPLLFVCTPG